jgi:hypothetical protein
MAASAESDRSVARALTERDIAVLDFERQWWRHAGAKSSAFPRPGIINC